MYYNQNYNAYPQSYPNSIYGNSFNSPMQPQVRSEIVKVNGNAPVVQATPLEVSGTTDFLKAAEGKNSVKVFDVIDELMDVIKVTNGRLYNSVMRKIDEIE